MIQLKSFNIEDGKYLVKWISSELELVQFAGPFFTFPINKEQLEHYLSDPNRIVFRVESESNQAIGMAEISIEDNNVVKLARILIGEKSMRGKGAGTELINKLVEYSFSKLKAKKVILNVYSWNIGAIKCYQKVGFSQTDKPIEYVRLGNEVWETIEMEKTINSIVV